MTPISLCSSSSTCVAWPPRNTRMRDTRGKSKEPPSLSRPARKTSQKPRCVESSRQTTAEPCTLGGRVPPSLPRANLGRRRRVASQSENPLAPSPPPIAPGHSPGGRGASYLAQSDYRQEPQARHPNSTICSANVLPSAAPATTGALRRLPILLPGSGRRLQRLVRRLLRVALRSCLEAAAHRPPGTRYAPGPGAGRDCPIRETFCRML